jgi:uncharacterized protein (DUF2267 family)
MQSDDFFGQVQSKARLDNLDAAMLATRATLATLAERIGEDEAGKLGAQLPRPVADELRRGAAPVGKRFDSDEFLQRVSEREGVDLPLAVHHARAVLEVLQQAVSGGEINDVKHRLPDDYQRLFAGSQGKMPGA